MKLSLTNRRALGLVAVLLGTQLLSACVVLPVPAHRHRGPVVVEVEPGYQRSGPPPRHHDHRRDRDRDWRR
jgi:hypothetical protein